ncbi:hypothetical protein jhhlp_002081 [Lomentospora prolificans]|uniref:Uncharacterized protein n=1 Tax=Lomentospora prolificans TaxID=41688 RepID=A0A2N3ND15_9PEZI|nr:hypothetical protein jhhlp_002081 [Lomentospora prolificans]
MVDIPDGPDDSFQEEDLVSWSLETSIYSTLAGDEDELSVDILEKFECDLSLAALSLEEGAISVGLA